MSALSFDMLPGGAGAASTSPPVSLLLAGPAQRVEPWMRRLLDDGRFRVLSLSHTQEDLREKLAGGPEVLLLDAVLMGDEPTLVEFLSQLSCPAYVVTPAQGGEDLTRRVQRIETVKAAYYAELNLAEAAGRIYTDAVALRARRGLAPVWSAHAAGPAGGPTGLRIITVWNHAGGVGKTTVASNLAYEAARRSFPTLLIGLGAPDDLPLVCGIKPEPNITRWWEDPSPEGIRLAAQKLDTLDVIAGFPDVLAEAQALVTPREAPNAIPNLITTAAHYAGYSVIVVDAPPTALAAAAISVSNTLVLVARPSLEGILRTVEAYRTVVERLKFSHRIPPERVFVVLNRVGSRLAADEWHRAAAATAGGPFPPIVAQIPDLPAVGLAQDSRRMPLLAVEPFERALRPLADCLLPLPAGVLRAQAATGGRRAFQIGGLRIRL